jgi:hypothetical protein
VQVVDIERHSLTKASSVAGETLSPVPLAETTEKANFAQFSIRSNLLRIVCAATALGQVNTRHTGTSLFILSATLSQKQDVWLEKTTILSSTPSGNVKAKTRSFAHSQWLKCSV